jgi:hypothetical protein
MATTSSTDADPLRPYGQRQCMVRSRTSIRQEGSQAETQVAPAASRQVIPEGIPETPVTTCPTPMMGTAAQGP